MDCNRHEKASFRPGRRPAGWSIAACLVLLAGCTLREPRQPAALGRGVPLLLISIDGFRADYLERGVSSALAKLARTGVRARAMRPSFPTLTFPNHYTLVTGLYPDHHGIIHNRMYVPGFGRFSPGSVAAHDGRWWGEAEPIWVTADKQNRVTATLFWPGSEADIHGHRPDYWRHYDERVTAAERVAQVLTWLKLPAARRPDFMTLYFSAVDAAGHRYGPDSPEVDRAIHKVDAAVALLVAGLRRAHWFRRMNILVVSDHGMATTPPGQWIRIDALLDLGDVRMVTGGALAEFIPRPGHAREVVAKLLKPHPHMRCWRRTAVPARLHYGRNPRIPPLVCLAATGWQITTARYLATHENRMPLGGHGYDNAAPAMRALFIAHGPAFRRGLAVPAFPNVDVYPLMAHLLGILPRPNDGDYHAVAGMLKPEAR